VSDFPGGLIDLDDPGGSPFLFPGYLIVDGDEGDDLDFGGAGWLPPYAPYSVDVTNSPRWNPTPSNWYSMFWVVLGPDFGVFGFEPLLLPFVPGPNVTVGSTATPEQIHAIKQQIIKWKSAHGYADGVILYFPDVVCPGPKTLLPFTQRADLYPIPWCEWRMGKALQDGVFTLPFTPGGYQLN